MVRARFKYVTMLVILCYFLSDVAFVLSAQGRQGGISILSFREDPTDLTANLQGTTVYDQNGDKCALIKIRTTVDGLVFDTGMMGVVDVQYDAKNHPGEVWLYVPFGIKKLSIQHSDLGSVDYPIKIQVQRAHTYVMELTTDKVVVTTIQKRVNYQYVIFKVFPEDAVVILNKKVLKTENGSTWDYVKFGTYEWTVVGGEFYLPQKGVIKVNDSKQSVIKEISLQPTFGTLEFPGRADGIKGASVYIDGVKVGKVPLGGVKLLEGRHEIILVKDCYKSKKQTLTIAKGESVQIDPELEHDGRPVELLADYGARIYVDDKDYGLSSWKGELSSGVHVVSVTKENHIPSEQVFEITSSRSPVHFKLDSPVLKTGSIRIYVTPTGSDVFIDGKKCGKTPYFQSSIGIGEHRISITNPDCYPYYATINVSEGETYEIKTSLNRTVSVNLASNVRHARFEIDGKDVNYAGDVARVDVGSHNIVVTAPGYRRKSRKVNVEKDTDEISVRLKHRIEASGGIGISIGGVSDSSPISVNRSGMGVGLGLPAYFSIGNGYNFLNFRINLTPSIAAWESGDPIIYCPATVGARMRFGHHDINYFLEPEFGYNLTNDNSSTAMFGFKTGIGLGVLDFNFGAYWSCLDKTVYVDQIKPLYWSFGMVFNFNNK